MISNLFVSLGLFALRYHQILPLSNFLIYGLPMALGLTIYPSFLRKSAGFVEFTHRHKIPMELVVLIQLAIVFFAAVFLITNTVGA